MSRLLDSGHANWSTQPEPPYLLVPIFCAREQPCAPNVNPHALAV
jgi:hypothetical protein